MRTYSITSLHDLAELFRGRAADYHRQAQRTRGNSKLAGELKATARAWSAAAMVVDDTEIRPKEDER